jgi:hypothetical protein
MIPTSLTQGCTSSQQAIVYTYDIANVAPTGVTFTVNNPLGRLTKVDFQGGNTYIPTTMKEISSVCTTCWTG